MSDAAVDLLIVGGGPAGLGAARGYREAGGAGSVLLISADQHPPYARPPLTKEYLRGESDADELPLAPPDWYAEQSVSLRLGTPVTAVSPDRHEVQLSNGETVGYRALVLATGSGPVPLPVPGGNQAGIIYVRDRLSAEALRGVAERGGSAIVIGSGFIGCEAAASLARRGVSVQLVTDEDLPHRNRLGEAAGTRIRDWLEAEHVELVLGDPVVQISAGDDGWLVGLDSGRALTADAVISGSGARPNIELAEAAGLRLAQGGVATDATLRTSDPAIWAVGDVACAQHPVAGRPLRVEHWGEAEKMGEIAGANVAGAGRRWDSAPGFWSAIGDRVLKYSAWGDGFDDATLVEGPDGWAVWYARDDAVVGVLAHEWDEVYERGQTLIERHAAMAEVISTSPRSTKVPGNLAR